MSIRDDLNTVLKESLKAKDQVSMSTIRLINAAVKDRDIAERSNGNSEGIEDAAILSLMQSMVKQRQERKWARRLRRLSLIPARKISKIWAR